MTAPFRDSPRIQQATRPMMALRSSDGTELTRDLIQEVPVALVFDGSTAAVMMASPVDIEDFAMGFALTEGFINHPDEIADFEQVAHDNGIEARFWLRNHCSDRLAARRRSMAGPVGCGMCGIDSLEQANRAVAPVKNTDFAIHQSQVLAATEALRGHQALHDLTRSAHAAGLLSPEQGILMAREDVGRHNALDKLIGAVIRADIDPAFGAIVMTSRVSVELVQKTAALGCPMLIAVSSPTALAADVARQYDITLATNVRGSGCLVHSRPDRIVI